MKFKVLCEGHNHDQDSSHDHNEKNTIITKTCPYDVKIMIYSLAKNDIFDIFAQGYGKAILMRTQAQ